MYGYIEHHGIKGQKWGVRNGPPYPIGSSVKKAMRRRRSAEKSAERQAESVTGSKVLDKAYNKIASMDREDWDTVRNKTEKAVACAKGSLMIAGALTAIGSVAIAGSLTAAYFIDNPDEMKGIIDDITALLGKSEIGEKAAEKGLETAEKVAEKAVEKAGKTLSKNGEKIAAKTREQLQKGLSKDMKTGDMLSTLRNLKKNASEEDYFNFLKNESNWKVISRDPKLLSQVAEDVSEAFGANAALAQANTNLKNVKQAWENRNMYTEKKMNKVTKSLGYGTALAGAFTNAIGAAENLYRKKDSPIVKDLISAGKGITSKYFNSDSPDESEYVKKK